jgi:Co/Zn/Cd efflux system component
MKNKGKTMKNTISSLLIITGIIMMAGSANDCDGKCMETANTLSEMLMIALLGLVVSGSGALLMAYKNNS